GGRPPSPATEGTGRGTARPAGPTADRTTGTRGRRAGRRRGQVEVGQDRRRDRVGPEAGRRRRRKRRGGAPQGKAGGRPRPGRRRQQPPARGRRAGGGRPGREAGRAPSTPRRGRAARGEGRRATEEDVRQPHREQDRRRRPGEGRQEPEEGVPVRGEPGRHPGRQGGRLGQRQEQHDGRPGEPPENLLLVKPYHWRPFRGYADVNNASGAGPVRRRRHGGGDDPHADGDEQLLWTADVLRRLHARFYSPSPGSDAGRRTVPDLLRSMRREVLGGHPRACLVFSGVVPLNQQNVALRVRPHLVRYAEELGGTVLPAVGPDVTHVVAKKDGSEKCN
ncbi:hypothetical protein THAOC_19327, partial [Thalassiosira oceanica]